MTERKELNIYPNNAEKITILGSDDECVMLKLKSYLTKEYLFYIITVPSQNSNLIMDILATTIDTNQKKNIIAHYKTESTISEYLNKC
jgi:hypothetical protein